MLLKNVKALKLKEAGFPDQLRHIDTPPAQIYFLGVEPAAWLDRPKVAIVGSRKATGYGRAVTDELASRLAQRDVIIISGLAFGVDSIAHKAALTAGGTTVSVLPTPISQIYPASHLNLARQIILQGGTLISEYADKDPVYRLNFIARNRIVSGLADILLITEAAASSGTMHTARFALEQGKTVMAVPGNINSPASEGCNNLIKAGAVPVTTPEDVLFALGISPTKKLAENSFNDLSPVEVRLIKMLQSGISEQEELALAARVSGSELSSALTMLEVAGRVRPLGAGRWTLA